MQATRAHVPVGGTPASPHAHTWSAAADWGAQESSACRTAAAAVDSCHGCGSAACAAALMRATRASDSRADGPQARHTAASRSCAAAYASAGDARDAGSHGAGAAPAALNQRSMAATSRLLSFDVLMVSWASWEGAQGVSERIGARLALTGKSRLVDVWCEYRCTAAINQWQSQFAARRVCASARRLHLIARPGAGVQSASRVQRIAAGIHSTGLEKAADAARFTQTQGSQLWQGLFVSSATQPQAGAADMRAVLPCCAHPLPSGWMRQLQSHTPQRIAVF